MSHPDRTAYGNRIRRVQVFHPLLATGVNARFEGAANAARADAERIGGNAQALRQLATALDSLSFRVPIVFDRELALLRLQLLQAAVEALEPRLLNRREIVAVAHRGRLE